MNSTPEHSPHTTEAPERWPVFICYRRADGKPAAEIIYRALQGAKLGYIPAGYSSVPVVDCYFDLAAPAVHDWKAIHLPALQAARTLVVICSPGAFQQLPGKDWTHAELDWWIEHRSTAPILIDPLGDGRWVPVKVQQRWPDTQRIEVHSAQWSVFPPDELAVQQERLRIRILEGIRAEDQDVVADLQARLEAERGRARSLSRQRTLLYVLVVALLGLAGTALTFFARASKAQKEAQRSAWHAQVQSVKALYARSFELSAEGRAQAAAAILAHALKELPADAAPEGEETRSDSIDWRGAIVRRLGALETPELTVLQGMASRVQAIAVDPTGKIAAVGAGDVVPGEGTDMVPAADTTVRIWNLEERREIRRFEKHTASIQRLVFASDGRRILSVDTKGHTFVWDSFTGVVTCELELARYGIELQNLQFTNDGGTIIGWTLNRSASPSDNFRGWDVRRCAALEKLSDVSASAGEVRLGWGDNGGLWSWSAGGSRLLPVEGLRYAIASATLSPGGSLIAVGQEGLDDRITDFAVLIWSKDDLGSVRRLEGHQSDVRALDFSRDGQLLVSGSDDGTIRVWDVRTGKTVWALEPHRGPVRTVAFAQGDSTVLAGGEDDALLYFSLPRLTAAERIQDTGLAKEFEGGDALVATEDGRYIFQAGRIPEGGPVIAKWEVGKEGKVVQLLTGHTEFITSLALTEDGRKLVSSAWDRSVRIWDVETGKEEGSLAGPFTLRPQLSAGPGRLLAVANDQVELWDVSTQKLLRVLDGLNEASAVALSGDGRRVAGGNRTRGDIAVWEVASGRLLSRLEGNAQQIERLGFSGDSRVLVAATGTFNAQSGGVIRWTGEPGEAAKRIPTMEGSVTSLLVSGDGKSAVLGGRKSLRRLDLETGRELARVDLPDGPIESIAAAREDSPIFASVRGEQLFRWSPLASEGMQGRREGIRFSRSTDELGEFAPIQPEGDLGAVLQSGDKYLRIHALRMLSDEARSDTEAMAALRLFDDTEADVRKAAILLSLRKPGLASATVPLLARLLTDKDYVNRTYAAYALAQLGPAASAAVPELVAALSQEDVVLPSRLQLSVRGAALSALEAIGEPAGAATSRVLAVCRGETDLEVRADCLSALGSIAAPSPEVGRLFVDALGAEEVNARIAAGRALCRRPAQAKEFVKELQEAYKTESHHDARVVLANCLRQLNEPY